MKVKAKIDFTDKFTGKPIKAGTTLEVDEERARLLKARKIAEIVEEAVEEVKETIKAPKKKKKK